MKQLERVMFDDAGDRICENGDLVRWFKCMCCDEQVIVKEIYKIQRTVCPFCNNKFKIRVYKSSGKVDITVR